MLSQGGVARGAGRSIFFHLAWYRLVVLGKEWPPMRLQVLVPPLPRLPHPPSLVLFWGSQVRVRMV